MKLTDPRLWLGLLATLAVGSVVFANLGRTMPGPLTHVHAQHEDIAGGTNCNSCHGGWFPAAIRSLQR